MDCSSGSKAIELAKKGDLLQRLQQRIGVRCIIYRGHISGTCGCELYIFGATWPASKFFWMRATSQISKKEGPHYAFDFEIWKGDIANKLTAKFSHWERPGYHENIFVTDKPFVGFFNTDGKAEVIDQYSGENPQLDFHLGLLTNGINNYLDALQQMHRIEKNTYTWERVEVCEVLVRRFNGLMAQRYT